ncbi:MAG TPA: hypothetical protein DDY68_06115 [Porphyromonadaceae bacterium]|nr:hypothetical protein [Porphyromonadaceae bacterium]
MIDILSCVLPPFFGGIIGYVTNDIAIRMLFRPHKAKYIFGIHVPFTPGIISKEKGRIASAMGVTISENLMNKETLERSLLSNELIEKIEHSIDSFCEKQRNNEETIQSFVRNYLSAEEVEQMVGTASSKLEKILVDKLSRSDFGNSIAHIAVSHAIKKVEGGLLGMFGASKLLEPIAIITEPLLAKEINNMISQNAEDIIHKLVAEQSNSFVSTPMKKMFVGHEEQIEQVKSALISLYRTVITEHLPKILSALNLSQMIEERINAMDMNEIEPLIFQVMEKELKAIVWLGAGLGALIGCVNIFV